MGEAAENYVSSDAESVVCSYCGQEQEAPAREPAHCIRCHVGLAPLGGGSRPDDGGDVVVRLLPSERANEAAENLDRSGVPSHAPRMVDELLALERRGHSFLALIPFVGPWLLRRSEIHGERERKTLTLLSVGVTLIAVEIAGSLLPRSTGGLTATHRRVEADVRVLADVAERYRADQGAYPDERTWRHLAEQADPRFFDPWHRPYHYRTRGDRIALETLGRDGVEGGHDEDADLSFEFPDRAR